MKQQLQVWWHFIRQLATDDSYERYVEHHRQHHAEAPVLDRRTFYIKEQQRKWTGVQRCC